MGFIYCRLTHSLTVRRCLQLRSCNKKGCEEATIKIGQNVKDKAEDRNREVQLMKQLRQTHLASGHRPRSRRDCSEHNSDLREDIITPSVKVWPVDEQNAIVHIIMQTEDEIEFYWFHCWTLELVESLENRKCKKLHGKRSSFFTLDELRWIPLTGGVFLWMFIFFEQSFNPL